MRVLSALALALSVVCAQAPQPNGAGLLPGTLPAKWATGGPDCAALPEFKIHEYNPDFIILRESGCTHYEKPFLYLIFGSKRALLVDTGAGKPGTAAAVDGVIRAWAKKRGREPDSVELIVAHSHSHDDHIAGDAGFSGHKNLTMVPLTVIGTQNFFSIARWPEQSGSVDLGERVIDVLPIPGHDVLSIALYDPKTGILLTGDSLYPGRLYVDDFPAYVASAERLVKFTEGKPVAHVLGNHIEEMSTPFRDYVVGTKYQPEEHELQLSRGHLLELRDAFASMHGKPARMAMRDFTIWPK